MMIKEPHILQSQSKKSLASLLNQFLPPSTVSAVDQGEYPLQFLKQLGKAGFFNYHQHSLTERRLKILQLIETVSEVCLSAAYSLWCHFACLTYVYHGHSSYLQKSIAPLLERGEILGGTGLSTPIKLDTDLEPLHLQAVKGTGGYYLTGCLPYVSNLASEHWFGVIAEVSPQQRIVALLPTQIHGLKQTEQKNFMGLNGTATHRCQFDHVFIPTEWVLAEDADFFATKIRSDVVFYQIGLSLGLATASIQSVHVNQPLSPHTEFLQTNLNHLQQSTYELAEKDFLSSLTWKNLLQLRLQSAQLAIQAAQDELLHYGVAGYLLQSPTSRRLRESYFISILPPTIKQIQKCLS